MSLYEEKILKILQSEGLIIHREKTFPNLKSLKGRSLRFDFYVIDKQNKGILLEVDGQFHFHQMKKVSEKDFKYRQEMDVRKNEYCLANGIPLYRIPYMDMDTINSYDDMFRPQYLVLSKWHNHEIRHKLDKGR